MFTVAQDGLKSSTRVELKLIDLRHSRKNKHGEKVYRKLFEMDKDTLDRYNRFKSTLSQGGSGVSDREAFKAMLARATGQRHNIQAGKETP